jgi:hypothetical protein
MIRIGGAQIPVTHNIKENCRYIKESIDWANANQVDFILTPEGSLSGYLKSFDTLEKEEEELQELEKEIASYATLKRVGLALGTVSLEKYPFGKVKCSQIRYYSQQGHFLDFYNKQMVIPPEESFPGEGPKIINFNDFGNHSGYSFNVGSFICNDMWGELNGKTVTVSDLNYYQSNQVKVIFHASNGYVGNDNPDNAPVHDKIKEWADIHLWMASRPFWRIPIITVDSCYGMQGNPSTANTSSTSGVIFNTNWLVKAKPSGIDYFYYDFRI